jgi:hypothetical protein
VIKPVSANSLSKTGIFAEKAGDFRPFPPSPRQTGGPETKARISGPFSRLLGSLAERRNGWLGRKVSNLDMAISTRSRLSERSYRTPISFAFISLSKHSNFENRTESAESRAPERNGHLEKNELPWPISSPEPKSEIAANTGRNCQQSCAENRRLRPSWRRERNWVRTFST